MPSPPDVHGHGDLVDCGELGRIYVEVEGEGTVTTVVVPGGPGVSHIHYHPWFSALAEHGRVVYFDYPGTGRSARLDVSKYTVPSYAGAIGAVVDALDAAEVNVIGVSFGGMPALELALTHRDRVRRLVLSNAQLAGGTWQATNIDNVNRELREQLPDVWAEIEALRARGVRSLDDRYQELLGAALPGMEWFDPADHPRLRSPETVEERFNPDVYRAFCGDDPEWRLGGSLAGYDRSAELAALTMPTLVVTGRFDRVTPPWVAHEIVRHLSNAPAPISFERSGHRPWAEEPREYFDTLSAFLR